MTKQQEIKALDAMIKMFGDDSYIGPWLKRCKGDILWCIKNDFPIESRSDLARDDHI